MNVEKGVPDQLSLDSSEEEVFSVFTDMGLCSNTASGLEPFSWAEIKAFSELVGDLLDPGDFVTLKMMSEDFVRGIELGKDLLSIEPVVLHRQEEGDEYGVW